MKSFVQGFGGTFIHSKQPKQLADWYAHTLGIPFQSMGEEGVFHMFHLKDEGLADRSIYQVWAIKPLKGELPPPGRFLVNYRVSSMEELLQQLQSIGVPVEKQEDGEYGRFAWIHDLDGNRIELWEPAP